MPLPCLLLLTKAMQVFSNPCRSASGNSSLKSCCVVPSDSSHKVQLFCLLRHAWPFPSLAVHVVLLTGQLSEQLQVTAVLCLFDLPTSHVSLHSVACHFTQHYTSKSVTQASFEGKHFGAISDTAFPSGPIQSAMQVVSQTALLSFGRMPFVTNHY